VRGKPSRPPTDVQRFMRNALKREATKRRREAAMSEPEARENLSLTEAEANALNLIAAGRPMRNATTVLRAIEMKLAYTMKKPAQQIDTDQKMTIEIVSLGDKPNPSPDDIVQGSPLPEKEEELP
jgi:regulator of protease activity HflC (stomatin/prohibitin superfamily)